MFLIDNQFHWSASDLTAAAGCEYALLCRLDPVRQAGVRHLH